MLSLKTMEYTGFYWEITCDSNASSYLCTKKHIPYRHPPTACYTLTEEPINTVRRGTLFISLKIFHKRYLEQDKCYHFKGKRWILFDFTIPGNQRKRVLRIETPSLAFVLHTGLLQEAVNHRNHTQWWISKSSGSAHLAYSDSESTLSTTVEALPF